ncbi:MAG: DUF4976 domain-containing protein, partial [Planctomycetes bacterium]|nr:DUF4976 domain-containing protein [Planctomycetota bacterium]
KPPAEIQGESLRPILRGRTPGDWRQSMYYRYYEYGDEGRGGWHRVRPHYGVRTHRYKLIHFQDDEIDAWELFDLERDPRELNNVYDNAAYADVVKRLKAELKRLRAHYGDSKELTGKLLEMP